MRAAGAPEAVVDRARARWLAAQPEPVRVEVYPENVDAFLFLLATADQWIYPGAMGGELTLPVNRIQSALQLLGMPTDRNSVLRVLAIVRAARGVKVRRYNAELEAARRRRE